jgi:nitrite reductase (NADH) small subunit
MHKVWVASVKELQETGKKIVTANGLDIGIFLIDGDFYAWRNVCPHAGAPICEGKLGGTTMPSNVYEYELGCEGQIMKCPWHGWEFDLKTGSYWVDPKVKLRGYPVEQQDEQLYLIMK